MIDVLIIGAGVVGCITARALSRYKLNVLIIDKASDVSEGATKANSGIVHAGYDAKPNTLKAKLNLSGNAMMKNLTQELSVEYSNTGSLVTAFDENQLNHLKVLYDRGIKNGVPHLELIKSKDKLHELEPELNDDVIAALHAPTAGIVCPWGLAEAACENALENGVELITEAEVVSIKKKNKGFIVFTNKGSFEANYVINAAGVFADTISSMAEDKWFSIKPRRGEYLLLDKKVSYLANKTIFGTPGPLGKGILLTPTVHGNLLLGPTSIDQEEKDNTDTTSDGLNSIFKKAKLYIPNLNRKDIITSFTGVRATPDKNDFIISASKQAPGFINAAGIDSPGLSSAPAIAELIVDILLEEGLKLEVNSKYNPLRKGIIHFSELSEENKAKLIKQNPSYGNVICRCETITEAEIIDAIRRPAGARTVDGIKRRVRAGMGRCQGGFCSPKVVQILSKELNLPATHVTKKGGESNILVQRIKDESEVNGL